MQFHYICSALGRCINTFRWNYLVIYLAEQPKTDLVWPLNDKKTLLFSGLHYLPTSYLEFVHLYFISPPRPIDIYCWNYDFIGRMCTSRKIEQREFTMVRQYHYCTVLSTCFKLLLNTNNMLMYLIHPKQVTMYTCFVIFVGFMY